MSSSYKTRYGLDFEAHIPDPAIEMLCWKKWKEPEFQSANLVDPWDCFWRGIYHFVPKSEFVRHRWAEEHVYDWTTEEFCITWGAASSGKSNDYGLLALMDWLVDPADTVTILASTTLGMLKLRSYESVVRYFKVVKKNAGFEIPGKLSKTTSAILLDDKDAEAVTEKASIRGVAVAEGSADEARAKLQGAHLKYVRLILDELSQMRRAAMEVRTNLSIGALDFKLTGMCNPDRFTDLACEHSLPLAEGGFKSLDPEKDEVWYSRFGKVRRHDGLRSPAIQEPNRTDLSFLLTQKTLDAKLKETGGNWDDAQMWTMIRAWPPEQGSVATLCSMTDVVAHGAMGEVQWFTEPLLTVVGIDPAFSAAGNRGAMATIDVGHDTDGVLRLHIRPIKYLKIQATSPVPALEQVREQIIGYISELYAPGVPRQLITNYSTFGRMVGVDDAATQSVADDIQSHCGMKPTRFVSNAKASETKLAVDDTPTAKDRVHNQSTELWAATASFIRAGQVRGLPMSAADQLTQRPVDPDRRPLRLVSKKAKARDGGQGSGSFDEMDAIAYAIGILRFNFGMIAGMTSMTGKYRSDDFGLDTRQDLREIARKFDIDAGAFSSV